MSATDGSRSQLGCLIAIILGLFLAVFVYGGIAWMVLS